MNTLLLMIIVLPILEVLLMIKIGLQIGAFNTIIIIFFTGNFRSSAITLGRDSDSNLAGIINVTSFTKT